jgi:hypothetical protein
MIHLAEGGESTDENLLLVDASCHAKIHGHPDRYPVETLKEAKRHWEQLGQLLPPSLYYESDDRQVPEGAVAQVRFHVAAANLDFTITAPVDLRVAELASFIRMWIMHPLVAFARLSPYNHMFGQAQLARMGLALKTRPRERLDASVRLADLPLSAEDALVALVDFEWVAAQVRTPNEDTEVRARATLVWESVPRDLDLHFIPVEASPSAHVCFRNRGRLSGPPWIALNVDIQTGFGPEVISVGEPAVGRWLVAVHNYSCDALLSDSNAVVRLDSPTGTQVVRCPRSGRGQVWKVCVIDCPSGYVEVINEIVGDEFLRELIGDLRGVLHGLAFDHPQGMRCPDCGMPILPDEVRRRPACPRCGRPLP